MSNFKVEAQRPNFKGIEETGILSHDSMIGSLSFWILSFDIPLGFEH